MSRDTLELGRIGSPYGIKGWVHVQSFTDPPDRLLKYREWILEGEGLRELAQRAAPVEPQVKGPSRPGAAKGRTGRDSAASTQVSQEPGAARLTMKLAEGRAQGASLVARLEGITDRDVAERLRGARINVARSALPKLRRNEFYQADLIGLSVGNLEGAELGTLSHFVETPGHPVMVVRASSGREHWVPATKVHLKKVDLAGGRVTVDWPVDLDETGPEEAEQEG